MKKVPPGEAAHFFSAQRVDPKSLPADMVRGFVAAFVMRKPYVPIGWAAP
jgi:hypothetical protein